MTQPSEPLWRRISTFVTTLDAKAVRAVWVTLALFALVGLVFLIGRTEWGVEATHALEHWMAEYRQSPLAVFIVILVFTLSAFIGVPQFVLIAACVVAFGPWWGFVYSWVATIVSAAVTFYMGRIIGAETLQKIGGSSLNRLSAYIGKNAFMASFIIRNVPSGPFIVVNMAFGVSHASFWAFLSGCALGVIPKNVLVALFGSSLAHISAGGDWKVGLLILLIAVIWLGIVIGARHLVERWRRNRA
ncbi:TVP38/TMEM64 family protein [Asticcacaulis tiandongensis]|uniref:TVP38/TMEM64 family protein n=1 Tax=Asticcacaulis tiandongensis TaxID=2565365 RepID=UPI0011295DA0|nr:VTT domain-containing protein [Asticcacaulis tiandongensis]